ncbi:MAG TPA: hypothetical protein VII23_10020, partial [Terriglobales bacterium]
STWDGDAGLSVVDRRFGARCLPPYFSRFRQYRKQLVVSIFAGLDLRFLLNRREPTPQFWIENECPELITNYSSSIIWRQTTTMGVCPNRLVLINGVSPAL